MTSFSDIISDALAYWEPRRLIYNLVLVVVTLGGFILNLPDSWKHARISLIPVLIVLAATANILYCAAYIVDVFVQLSRFREGWLQWRWLLYGSGLILALILAVPVALGMFSPHFD